MSRALARLACIALLMLMLVGGCALLKADDQMWENDKSIYFTGIVEADHETHGPLVVVLYQVGEVPEPVYVNVIPRRRGVYHIGVPGNSVEGRYGIVAFEDVNRDMRYSPGEPVAVYRGKRLPVSAINDPPATEAQGLGHIVVRADSAAVQVPPIFGESFAQLVRRREESYGGHVSIGESRFDAARVHEGLFEPLKFFEQGQAGLFMLQPFDPHKVPVILVHGIGGSPRDWSEVIRKLDKTRLQPWVAYYPSGVSIGHSAMMLDAAIDELGYRYPFDTCIIVAHSMGGLVAMGSLNIATREGRVPPVHHLVTLSTPWLGHQAARLALMVPTRSPDSWIDIAPDSEYLDTLLDVPRPPGLRHTLFFGYGKPSKIVRGNNDGVVALASVLAEPVQSQAAFVFGFDEDHASILKSDAMQTLLDLRLRFELERRQTAPAQPR
ncbi:MAG: alpha/beta hydrolase [Proteobacteria bacterium]|nr:alpha/beta hydrolase [Pseudomonadota bacterium]